MADLTNVSFRKITELDLDNVNTIEQKAHYHPWSKKLLKESIAIYQCWLMYVGQQIIGYGVFKVILDEAELLNIAIDPLLQGKGLGKTLLKQLMIETKKLGANECFLEVRESNHHAYHLYESYGFNEIGRRTNYYPAPQGHEDALIMACIL